MQLARISAITNGETVRFDVRADEPASLGRSSDCDLQVHDAKVSREHCRITLRDGRLHVVDSGSSHGLVHRGQRCTEVVLGIGDSFEVGKTTVRFDGTFEQLAPDQQQTVPVPRAAEPPPAAAPPSAPFAPGPPAAPVAPVAAPGGEAYPDLGPLRLEPRRRPAGPTKRLAARLAADSIVFGITTLIVLALLLLLRMKSASFDIYRLLDLFGLPKP